MFSIASNFHKVAGQVQSDPRTLCPKGKSLLYLLQNNWPNMNSLEKSSFYCLSNVCYGPGILLFLKILLIGIYGSFCLIIFFLMIPKTICHLREQHINFSMGLLPN